jgi:YjbE family integral membrane protein
MAGVVSFVGNCIYVAFLDVLLASDNIVVVAMAVRDLHPAQRRLGLLFGGALAILCRVLLTILVSRLLTQPWVQFIGGLAIFAIAIKLVTGDAHRRTSTTAAAGIVTAACVIVAADLAMSLDNMLAIAGASKGDIRVIIIGFAASMPLLLFTGGRLAVLMGKLPIIATVGAACLGRVAGDMIITDPGIRDLIHPSSLIKYVVQAISAVFVILSATLRVSGGGPGWLGRVHHRC